MDARDDHPVRLPASARAASVARALGVLLLTGFLVLVVGAARFRRLGVSLLPVFAVGAVAVALLAVARLLEPSRRPLAGGPPRDSG